MEGDGPLVLARKINEAEQPQAQAHSVTCSFFSSVFRYSRKIELLSVRRREVLEVAIMDQLLHGSILIILDYNLAVSSFHSAINVLPVPEAPGILV